MYTRIGILGRARQAIGIARLHAPREALYIDVKYNSHSHSHSPIRREESRLQPEKSGRTSFACMRRAALAYDYAAIRYRTELNAIPNADRSLRRAVAQADGFLSLSANDFSDPMAGHTTEYGHIGT
jgi:hypothetical protein